MEARKGVGGGGGVGMFMRLEKDHNGKDVVQEWAWCMTKEEGRGIGHKM